jgi:glycylpeptide N-tetradecanoyltransferase
MSASQSKTKSKAKAEDVIEDAVQDFEDENTSGSESDTHDGVPTNQPSTSSASKKKKKKRSKAAKALQALKPGSKIPQALVDEVLEKVRLEQGEAAEGVNEETVRQALDQMKIMDVLKGKAGIGGKNRKDAGDHKVRPQPRSRTTAGSLLVLGHATSSSAW